MGLIVVLTASTSGESIASIAIGLLSEVLPNHIVDVRLLVARRRRTTTTTTLPLAA
jgi:hypothetical protein